MVTVTAENPGMWQKEMKVLEETYRGNEFRVDFPLHLESLEEVVDDIEDGKKRRAELIDVTLRGFSRDDIESFRKELLSALAPTEKTN